MTSSVDVALRVCFSSPSCIAMRRSRSAYPTVAIVSDWSMWRTLELQVPFKSTALSSRHARPGHPDHHRRARAAQRRGDVRAALLRIARAHLVGADDRRAAPLRASDAATSCLHSGGAARGAFAGRDRDGAAHASRATNPDESRLGSALAILEGSAAVTHRRARNAADASDELHRLRLPLA